MYPLPSPSPSPLPESVEHVYPPRARPYARNESGNQDAAASAQTQSNVMMQWYCCGRPRILGPRGSLKGCVSDNLNAETPTEAL